MLQDLETELKLRGFTKKTVSTYLWQNSQFLKYIRKQPTDIQESDIKSYLAHLISDKEEKPASVNLAFSSLKFYYDQILKKDLFKEIKPPKLDKKIPTVLSKDEIKILLASIKNSKHRLLVEFMYASGLRVSEAISIKINDLNLDEKLGIVRSGKGQKDRNFILSENLVKNIREYMNVRKEESEYLFPTKIDHIKPRFAQKIVSEAAKLAGIKKRVFCHALRSSFATHLLEAGTDIRIIQELLGHSNLATTERYTKVSTEQIKKVVSPFDRL